MQIQRLFLHLRSHSAQLQHPSDPLDALSLTFAAADDVVATRELIAEYGGALFLCEDQNSQIVGMVTLALKPIHGETQGMVHMTCALPQQPDTAPGSGLKAWLMSLWVEPHCRRHGVGSLLVRHVLDAAISRQALSVALTYDPADPSLDVFYRQLGFRLT